jgi:hypothetical protein
MAAGTLVDAIKAEFAKHDKDDASRAMVGALTWTDLSAEFTEITTKQNEGELYMGPHPLGGANASMHLTFLQRYLIDVLKVDRYPLSIHVIAAICEFADNLEDDCISLVMSDQVRVRFDGKAGDPARILITEHGTVERSKRYGGMVVVMSPDETSVSTCGYAAPPWRRAPGHQSLEKAVVSITRCLACGSDVISDHE